MTDTVHVSHYAHPDHMAVHRAAFHRARRLQCLDAGLWLVGAGLGAATLFSAVPWYAAAGGVVVLAALLWRRTGHRDTVAAREIAARRAEFVAYCARQRASDPDMAPDRRADPEHARLCAAIDDLEAVLPWWYRTA